MNIAPNTYVELISKSKIRYGGTFVSATPETISLVNLRSYGTEDRECMHQVEPSENVYSSMTFKISNIEQYKTDKWNSVHLHKYGQYLDVKIPDYEYEFEDQNRNTPDFESLQINCKKYYDSKKSFYDDFNR